MIDSLSFRILEYCRDEFRPIKPLINEATSRTVLYIREKHLRQKGWLQSDDNGKFRTTKEGLHQLDKSVGDVPEGLSEVYPPLRNVPSEQHIAAIELAIAGITARKNELREDRFPFILIMGPPLSWKTSLGKFVTTMVGADPNTHILDAGSEEGLSIWIRRTGRGEISTKRNMLEEPVVVFDEFQNSSPASRRLLKLWTSGNKIVAFENDKVTIQATTILLMNPLKGKTLEERTGLGKEQIRRGMILDLANVAVASTLALEGEKIIADAKAYGPLALPKPQGDCTKFKTALYEFLSHTLTEEGRSNVDLETLLMLGTALTGWLEEEKAIKRILYDAFLCYQTTSWVLPDWKMQLERFPETVPRDTVTPDSATTEIIPRDKQVEAFKLLESDSSPIDLVTKLGLTYPEAEQTAKRYFDLRNIQIKNMKIEAIDDPVDTRVKELGVKVQIARLEHELLENTTPVEVNKELAELRITLEAGGKEKRRQCYYYNEKYCTEDGWMNPPETTDHPRGDPIFVGKSWHVNPTPISCAVCPSFLLSYEPLAFELEEKMTKLSDDLDNTKTILSNTPGQNLRESFTCNNCGAKGLVAVRIHCTQCGAEDWWGYHAKK